MSNNTLNLTDNQNKFNINNNNNNNNNKIIQSMLFIAFKLMKSIFDLAHTCVDI